MENELTPAKIVKYLDKFIIGQDEAKKKVAIALRNRIRRQRLPKEMQEEVTPKNILMIGPTGVGKTEIARRLAKLVSAPFLKVEASKYTEVGYVGRDVESMIRDVVQMGINMVREEHMKRVQIKAEEIAEEKLLDLLVPPVKGARKEPADAAEAAERKEAEERLKRTREKIKDQLHKKLLEDKMVEVNVRPRQMPMMEIFSGTGVEEIGINIQDIMGGMGPRPGSSQKKKKVSVAEAREIIVNEEMQKLIDMDKVTKEAVSRVENTGIIFIDEIDKVAGSSAKGSGPDVSREGVQRDILPIVEGTTVNTKHGPVKTDHILFIGAGAFHISKPSDLIPELQGRFPIRVELDSLTKEDFEKILMEPENSIIKQYIELLSADDVKLNVDQGAIESIAAISFEVNENTENIGARRLHTVVEKLLEQVSFEAPYGRKEKVEVSKKYVEDKLKDIVKDRDLSKYIL